MDNLDVISGSEYRRLQKECRKAQNNATKYRNKYLTIRRHVRNYFKGTVSKEDLQHWARW